MVYTDIKHIAIIGAGVAGLATARSVLQAGRDCTIFERSSVLGGVWSDGYLNFGVQVQRELYEFSDWPLPPEAPDFTPGPTIETYLNSYATHFGITPKIRFNSKVVNIDNSEHDSNEWTVTYVTEGESDDGEIQTGSFDMVVVCIGLYSNQPHIPQFDNMDNFRGEILHNSQLKHANQLENKRVAVVGFGKSATDAALEASKAGLESHIVFRKAYWPIPQKLAGVLPFKWGLLHRLNSTLIPPYQSVTPVENWVHTLGKPLVWLYWRLVEWLLIIQCRLAGRSGKTENLIPDEPIEIGAFSEATMVPRPEFYRSIRAGKISAHRTGIREFRENQLVLENGDALDVDLVILATGWKNDFSFIGQKSWMKLEPGDDGFYLYRHILHPATPGLVFIGRAASVSSILTYSLQAYWLGELLKGNITLPADSDILENIHQMRAWKRSWIPFSASRSARLIAHTQHYHDELLRDAGENPLRKTGFFAPLKELIFPYDAKDYAGIFKHSS